jgi:hypothetical protein
MRKLNKTALQAKFVVCWMETRPYANASSFDLAYIALAPQVLSVLEDHDYYFSSFGLDQSDLAELAVFIVAYFEDFINEVGIWKAFVVHNRERFGDYLPFFHISDHYDTEYINAEDICFLIWQWLMVQFQGKKMFSPVADPILEMGVALFTMLEDRIEDMPASDAQDEFLTFDEDDSFFKIRIALEWLSGYNYLFGCLGFKYPLAALVKEGLAFTPHKSSDKEMEMYAYDLRLSHIFSSRCMLGGLTTCEWAARILRCPPAVKSKLLGVGPRLADTFIYVRQDAHHYFFQHHPTLKEVHVAKVSIDLDPRPGDVSFFSIIKWGDEFWSQGICFEFDTPERNPNPESEKTIPTLLLSPQQHAVWLETADFYERKFLEVIGAQWFIFPNPKAAFAAQAKVFQAIAEEVSGRSGGEVPGTGSDKLAPDLPLAMFYVPGQGISYCPTTPRVIDFLLHPATSLYHRNEITNTLFRFVHPFGVKYIMENFPAEHLGWEGMDIDAVKDAAFLSTYFLPEAAGPPLPWITFVDRSA